MADLCFFNVQDGYAEAILRGFRKGFLNETNYSLLKNCKDLKEVKAVLGETDYGDFVKEFNETDVTNLKSCLKKKLSDEIDYIQANSGPELQKFIQIIRHKYMIDNVINIIEGSKNRTNKEVILNRSEPLGFLPEISGLINLEEVRKLDELYEDVLIDTEVGYYFLEFLDQTISQAQEDKNINFIQNALQEITPEKIKNSLKKIWLEYFYCYCQTLNDTTKEMMDELLSFEADCQAIQIIYNSLSFQGGGYQEAEREKTLPQFGTLYPTSTLQLSKVNTFEGLKEKLTPFPLFYDMVKDAPDPKKYEDINIQSGLKTLDDVMFEQLSKKASIAFEQQFHYACVYAYIKLREQEIKNILWLAEIITLDRDQSSKLKKNYIVPFEY